MHRSPYELILPENSANSQKGKIIIITGAGQGLGQASANVWARAGVSGIVLAGRRVEMLEETAKGIRGKYKGAEVLVVQTDVTMKEDVKNLFVEVKAKFGRGADVLLTNAGYFEDLGLIGDADVDDWWNAMVSICLRRKSWKKGN
jgi:NADP-dependent 3-hydroxy acid dehydrogenase YdfG